MNPVVHFEIPADDLKRAQQFYQDTFGWLMQEVPEMDYVMAQTTQSSEEGEPLEKGRINGGMMKKDPTAQHPVIVVDVEDLDNHLEKVEKNGGKVVLAKQEVGDFGLYARVEDTEGNIIGLFQHLHQDIPDVLSQ